MKLRRSERMVVISNYLINHPYELTSLNTFAKKYESAKSSISEDIVIIKRAFEEMEIGHIETITGAGGGVVFTPSISDEESKEIVEELCQQLSESNRLYLLIRFVKQSENFKQHWTHHCQSFPQ